MKKIFLLAGCIILAIKLNAQVGVNVSNPNATLEVASAPNDLNQVDGFIPPKLSGDELKAKDELYHEKQTGAIVYVTAVVTTTSPKTVNVTTTGYYYFDGTVWQKMQRTGVAGSVNAVNGLTMSGDNVKLGGVLTDPSTDITLSPNNNLKLKGTRGMPDVIARRYLVLDPNDNIRAVNTDFRNTLSIPAPAVFTLRTEMVNFLNGIAAGSSQIVNFVEEKNAIPGLTYDELTHKVSFQPGTYQISLIYEGVHNNTGCTLSSYFVNFPTDTGNQRIHSTASHLEGGNSNHGGTITYTTHLTQPKEWESMLGRGQSGNCAGRGMRLFENSTQLLIFRLGD
jgi:hypothetical protein